MQVMARPSRKKSWQTGRQRVSVEAALAIQRENVMQRLVRLRADIGHPEKAGEPLPQDQAAARAGVTARQWQRWESGASVPYARNLSAVAEAFGIDVTEFYDGPAGRELASTPDPFHGRDDNADQLDRIERKLDLLITALGVGEDPGERVLAAAEQARHDIREAAQAQTRAAAKRATKHSPRA